MCCFFLSLCKHLRMYSLMFRWPMCKWFGVSIGSEKERKSEKEIWTSRKIESVVKSVKGSTIYIFLLFEILDAFV